MTIEGVKRDKNKRGMAWLKRAVLWGVVTVVFLLVAIAVTQYYFGDYLNRLEQQDFRARLEKIPNVQQAYVGDRTGSSSEGISAEIVVAGKGPMTFVSLSDDSLGHAEHISLAGIGPYAVRTRGVDEAGMGYSGWAIDLGPNGPLAQNLNAQITSVSDAIKNYDLILSLVEKWPKIKSEWPERSEEIQVKDGKGKEYYVALKWAANDGAKLKEDDVSNSETTSPDGGYFALTRGIPDVHWAWNDKIDRFEITIWPQSGGHLAEGHLTWDCPSPRLVTQIGWSPDSKYLVMTTAHSEGHMPWHFESYLFCVSDRTVRVMDDTIGLVTRADFSFAGPHTVSMTTKGVTGDATVNAIDLDKVALQMKALSTLQYIKP